MLNQRKTARILMEFDFKYIQNLTEYYSDSHYPLPNSILDWMSEKAYLKAIKRVGVIRELNKYFTLESHPEIKDQIAEFTQVYTNCYPELNNPSCINSLQFETLKWSEEVLIESIIQERANIKGLAKEMGTASFLRGLEGDYSDHTDYIKKAIISTAMHYNQALAYLKQTNPKATTYIEIPEDIEDDFTEVLEKIHLRRGLENHLPLEKAVKGFYKELFLSLTPEQQFELKNKMSYRCYQLGGLPFSELESALEDTIWTPRSKPFFYLPDADPNSKQEFLTVKETEENLGISPISIRNRARKKTRKGTLNGIKIARGKYVIDPIAGMWHIHQPSILELRGDYNGLIASRISRLPNQKNKRYLTIAQTAASKQYPSEKQIRRLIKRHNLPIQIALLKGLGERIVLSRDTRKKIKKLQNGKL